jgi:hypothetical protein
VTAVTVTLPEVTAVSVEGEGALLAVVERKVKDRGGVATNEPRRSTKVTRLMLLSGPPSTTRSDRENVQLVEFTKVRLGTTEDTRRVAAVHRINHGAASMPLENPLPLTVSTEVLVLQLYVMEVLKSSQPDTDISHTGGNCDKDRRGAGMLLRPLMRSNTFTGNSVLRGSSDSAAGMLQVR